jgi:hypothetical protein
VAGGDLVENRPIVGMFAECCVIEVGPGEAFIGAARIDHDPHAGPVDRVDRRKAILVGTARDRTLAVVQDRN